MQTSAIGETQKMSEAKPNQKEKIKTDIVKLVRYFEDSFAIGVKYRIASQKYYRAAERAGLDLRELIEELNTEQRICTYMNEKGAVLIMVPEMAELIQQDDYGLITEEAKEILKSKWKKD